MKKVLSVLLFVGIAFAACFSVLVMVGSFTRWTFINPTETKESYKYDIKAVNDTEQVSGGISGNMFYTSGYIKEELYYYVIASTDKGYLTIKIPASNTYVSESNEQNPRLVVYEEFYIRSGKKHPYRFEFTTGYYELIIPIGSTSNKFNIDLE